MAKVSQYPIGTVNDDVYLLGTDPLDGNATKNYKVEDIVSAPQVQPSVLNFFDFSSSSTTTADQGEWTPLVCDTTEGLRRNGLSLVVSTGATSTKVAYSGSDKFIRFSFIISLIGASSRKIHVAMFKNNQLWPCSEFAQSIGAAATEITLSSQCVTPLTEGDVLEVYVKCSTHALSVDLDNVNVIISQI
jgi:hypothetical protein